MSKTRYITYSAMLLALTFAVQSIRTMIPALNAIPIFGPFTLSTLIIGSLVNLILIISARSVGFWSGVAVGVLSTVISFFQGHLPAALPQMILVVSVGNIVIVTFVYLLKKWNFVLSLVIASIAKFLTLWGMITLIIVPVFTSNEAVTSILSRLSVLFSWPQLVTASIGSVLALIISPRLGKSISSNKK